MRCLLARDPTGRRRRVAHLALLSFLLSVYLWFNGDKDSGLFVGVWVPSILSFGAFVRTIRR